MPTSPPLRTAVKVLKWLGARAVQAAPAVAAAGSLAIPGLPPILAGAATILGPLIHGAVAKAQNDLPEPGKGVERGALAMQSLAPVLRSLLIVVDLFLPGDIDEDGVVAGVQKMVSGWADVLKGLGLRELAAAGLQPSPQAQSGEVPGSPAPEPKV